MLTEIHMDAVASFKQAASLKTDKKINLIYGLNGTGKSTISNFLYDHLNDSFSKCKKTPDETAPILVYNQQFIQDNFFVADSLKGIFSLSKQNKDAEEKIANAEETLRNLSLSLEQKRTAKKNLDEEFRNQRQKAANEVWDIKNQYAGGDRVLEYCLTGLMGAKDTLFSHLEKIIKPTSEPKKNIQKLRDEVGDLKGNTAQPQQTLPLLMFSVDDVELDASFGTSILGNADSEVATLIDKLGNADWVKQGIVYLPEEIEASRMECPFCQENTITSKFIASIKEYFDDTYQRQIDNLERLKERYTSALKQLPDINTFIDHPFSSERKHQLSSKYQALIDILHNNFDRIDQKIKSPKAPQTLTVSSQALAEFNQEITAINEKISAYNLRLENRDAALVLIKNEFWSLMRWQYDQTMTRFKIDQKTASKKIQELDSEISNIDSSIKNTKSQIALAQKETVNVDEAVNAINAGILDLGMDDFKISKHSEKKNLYRIIRTDDPVDVFHSLSEGEKMIISFLYFCELCKGKSSVEDTHVKRIIVIDDPISSLSHIFVFNVGHLIRSIFFKDDRFSQVFILTHSLYFFYELTDPNHERRKDKQKLFRITKSSLGSDIEEMKYEEIQNDYHSYWSVINDQKQPPALIANCMRNVVEYFFNFVRKKDLNNIFQMQELQELKFQAFYRYINRESHSFGQNIIDLKEFNYETFKEGLRLVFEKTGYADHFNEMSKM